VNYSDALSIASDKLKSALTSATQVKPPEDMKSAHWALKESAVVYSMLFEDQSKLYARFVEAIKAGDTARVEKLQKEWNELGSDDMQATAGADLVAWATAMEETSLRLEVEPPVWLEEFSASIEALLE
jgi:hypothetical protein